MKQHVKRLLDEHDSPKHASAKVAQDDLAPANRAVAKFRKQIAEFSEILRDIEAGDPDGSAGVVGTIEALDQALGAMRREVDAIDFHTREFGKAYRQWHQNIAAVRTELVAKAEAVG